MKQQFKNIIEGENVYLEQVSSKFFMDIVKWRNMARIKRFINQPQELTLAMQLQWYNEIYAKKENECLYVMVDRITDRAFGTTGITDFNRSDKSCVTGHYLIGEDEYLQSVEAIKAGKLFIDYCLGELGCERLYCHIVCDNTKVINMQIKNGFKENALPKFPQYTTVAGKELMEFLFDKNDIWCAAARARYNRKLDQVLRVLK